MVSLVEKHAQGVVFDYSATNLLAVWIREAIDKVPSLASAAALVQALGETLQLTSGHAQTEVWNAFRDIARPADLNVEALGKINSVQDLGKSCYFGLQITEEY